MAECRRGAREHTTMTNGVRLRILVCIFILVPCTNLVFGLSVSKNMLEKKENITKIRTLSRYVQDYEREFMENNTATSIHNKSTVMEEIINATGSIKENNTFSNHSPAITTTNPVIKVNLMNKTEYAAEKRWNISKMLSQIGQRNARMTSISLEYKYNDAPFETQIQSDASSIPSDIPHDTVDIKRSMDFFQFDFPVDKNMYSNLHAILSNVSSTTFPNGTVILSKNNRPFPNKHKEDSVTDLNFYNKHYYRNILYPLDETTTKAEIQDQSSIAYPKHNIEDYWTTEISNSNQAEDLIKQNKIPNTAYNDSIRQYFNLNTSTTKYRDNLFPQNNQFDSYATLDENPHSPFVTEIGTIKTVADGNASFRRHSLIGVNHVDRFSETNRNDNRGKTSNGIGNIRMSKQKYRGGSQRISKQENFMKSRTDGVRSDEDEHQCSKWQHTCANGHCIDADRYCDGVVHCDDYSDELPGCSGEAKLTVT